MATLHEITRLKKEVESLKAKVAHSKGVIDQMMKEYREVMDESTFHECMEALQERRIEAEMIFQEKLSEFRKKYYECYREWPALIGPPKKEDQPKPPAKKRRKGNDQH